MENTEGNIIDRTFKFDFRFYTAYTAGGMQKSGVYTFKTIDSDSKPYNHKITSIEPFLGSSSN